MQQTSTARTGSQRVLVLAWASRIGRSESIACSKRARKAAASAHSHTKNQGNTRVSVRNFRSYEWGRSHGAVHAAGRTHEVANASCNTHTAYLNHSPRHNLPTGHRETTLPVLARIQHHRAKLHLGCTGLPEERPLWPPHFWIVTTQTQLAPRVRWPVFRSRPVSQCRVPREKKLHG